MKKYLIYKKVIEVHEKNNLWCSRQCKYAKYWAYSRSYSCKLTKEDLICVEDGKLYSETFLRSENCLKREEQ